MAISNPVVEQCIEDCLHCIRWCAECRDEGLTMDPETMTECIRLCGECLEVCRTCIILLAGSSPFAHRLCEVSAGLCTACAAECGKYEGETMQRCAEACRQCAASCNKVAVAGPLRRAA